MPCYQIRLNVLFPEKEVPGKKSFYSFLTVNYFWRQYLSLKRKEKGEKVMNDDWRNVHKVSG